MDRKSISSFDYAEEEQDAPCLERCSKFCYDPLTKKFCGRTCISWIRIVVYYTLFCSILLVLFLAMVNAILGLIRLQKKPIYNINRSGDTSDGDISVFPVLNLKAPIIWYFKSNVCQHEKYSNEIRKKLAAYTDKGVQECSATIEAKTTTKTAQTTKGAGKLATTAAASTTKSTTKPTTASAPTEEEESITEATEAAVEHIMMTERPLLQVFRNNTKPCKFDISLLDSCATYPYGYPEGEPCIYLKINNRLDWVPHPYSKTMKIRGNVPEKIKELIKMEETPKMWIMCEGHNPWDKDNLVKIDYFPNQGIDSFFYPYVADKNYQSPLIAIKISPVKYNGMILTIACNMWMHADYPIQALFQLYIKTN